MNPRDLPEVVAELIIEMHEVRSELNAINGRLDRMSDRIDRLEQTVEQGLRQMREENRENTDRFLTGMQRMLDPFLNRLLAHDDQLKNHSGRLDHLENPS